MKNLLFVLLVLVTLFWLFNFNCQANAIKVCSSCNVNTLKEAIQMAQPGDTLLVQKGLYQEKSLEITKRLVLLGQNNPVLDFMNNEGLRITDADSVVIRGFHIKNIGISYTKDYAALHLYKADYFTLENNLLSNVFFGILVEKSHYGLINNNRVSSHATEEFNSGNGIHIWHSDNITVTNNHVSHLRDGIYFEFVNESIIANNISTKNVRYGLHFMFSNHDSYHDNEFIDNGAGVAVMFSKFIDMRRNKFFKNWGTASFGLLLKEIYDAEIVENTFEENTIGINIENSTRINYTQNNLVRNGWAVKIAGGCYTNIFTKNNFISNSFDVSYNSKMNDNEFAQNYWSSYTGYDLDKDGIGDVPYRPVKLFSYIVNQTPETIVLLRSLFIDILNFSEKVSPVFTPDNLVDSTPQMKMIHD